MDKGFVYFNDSKIPFVIENYRMELFTGEPILSDFCKEYNFKDSHECQLPAGKVAFALL